MQTLTDKNFDAFAKAVRAELSDLPKREIQELTEGLEADLAERFAEEGPGFEIGSAAEYASELREAAGITPKPEKRKAFSSQAIIQNLENSFVNHFVRPHCTLRNTSAGSRSSPSAKL